MNERFLNDEVENFILNRIEAMSKKSGTLSETDIQELNVLTRLYATKNESEKINWEANDKIDRLKFEREKFERELDRDIYRIDKESFGDKARFVGDVIKGVVGPLAGTLITSGVAVCMTRSAYNLEVNGGVQPRWLKTPKVL